MCGSSLNVYGLTTAISHELEYIHATPLFSAAKCIHILAKQSFFSFLQIYKLILAYNSSNSFIFYVWIKMSHHYP